MAYDERLFGSNFASAIDHASFLFEIVRAPQPLYLRHDTPLLYNNLIKQPPEFQRRNIGFGSNDDSLAKLVDV
jgi:hypothetical protein